MDEGRSFNRNGQMTTFTEVSKWGNVAKFHIQESLCCPKQQKWIMVCVLKSLPHELQFRFYYKHILYGNIFYNKLSKPLNYGLGERYRVREKFLKSAWFVTLYSQATKWNFFFFLIYQKKFIARVTNFRFHALVSGNIIDAADKAPFSISIKDPGE